TRRNHMSEIPHVLIADPDAVVQEVGIGWTHSLGFDATGAATAEEALARAGQLHPDVLVLDTQLPGPPTVEILRRVLEICPGLPVIVTASQASVGAAVAAIKHGAAEYFTKPFDGEEFKVLLQSLAQRRRPGQPGRGARPQSHPPVLPFGAGLVGASAAMQGVFRLVAKVARNRYPVLILGESGTGKEVVARAIHYNSPERDRPFIPVDCGALVPSLIESELFGHVKGAYTGAQANRIGLLEVAQDGTIFLDEIGELPLDLQTKLLRAIQEREIRPVGGTRRVRMQARIIAATNRDLTQAVGSGAFRKDLFFRLNVISIKLPPLRERPEDIPELTQHFLEKFCPSGHPKQFSDAAMQLLCRYDWPGNVRELENCIERTLALSSGPLMNISDLPSALQQHGPLPPASEPMVRTIAQLEREAIEQALANTHNDKILAAKKLGIGKTTLYRKLKEYRTPIGA
ncbi:MAG: sigma-54-dependent transcriptional regulator, partial [Terriglobales bacterium]